VARHAVATILRARLRIDASEDLIDQLFTNNPPLHLLLIHLVRLVSTTDAAMRLPFALAGIMTVPVAYEVLLRLLGGRAAVMGAFLLAVSPLHVSYSQEARPTVLLVLFSMAALLFLIKAVEDGCGRDWCWFVAFALLDVWSSYFAAIAVFPALAIIWGILLLSRRRRLPDVPIRPDVRSAILAGAAIVVGCVPLIPDFLAVARMNGANASPSPSIGVSLLSSWWIVAQLANPLPTERLPSMLAAGLVASGLLAVVRFRTRGVAIALAWVTIPCVILTSIRSNHILNVRYVLASLPMVVAVATFGGLGLIPPPLRRAKPRVAHVLGGALLATLFLINGRGVWAYEELAIATGPIKPDWRGAVAAFASSAGPESCLVTIDGLGSAFSGVVPYYLEESDASQCSIDGRDPRLMDVASNHPDLWWAISNQWYFPDQADALTEVMRAEGEVHVFDFVVLVHPRDGTSGQDLDDIGTFLIRAVDAAEPERCRSSILAPSLRETLANLYALTYRDPGDIVPLVAGFAPPMGNNDELMWVRADQRLDRGDTDGARTIAVRLVGLYPGDPRTYELLARIERAAGHEAWQSLDRVAAALQSAESKSRDAWNTGAQCDGSL
jgi:mannosyltransferase